MQITVRTSQKSEYIDITDQIRKVVRDEKLSDGICMVFVPHTTAAVTINESADPAVRQDLVTIFNKLIPWEDGYRHMEGNSAAHMKTTLTGSSELIAVENGNLVLGTWQGLFFCEYDGPRTRKVNIQCLRS